MKAQRLEEKRNMSHPVAFIPTLSLAGCVFVAFAALQCTGLSGLPCNVKTLKGTFNTRQKKKKKPRIAHLIITLKKKHFFSHFKLFHVSPSGCVCGASLSFLFLFF